VFHFFKKYQEQHFKRFPPDPKIEEKWEKFQKEQEELKKKQEEQKKKDEEDKKNKVPIPTATSQLPTEKAAPEKVPVEEKKEIPKPAAPKEENKKPVEEKFKRISTYNGDVNDRYSWGQGVWDVNVQVILPPGTKPKMVFIKKRIIA
jgi:hypothetical protein